MLRRRFLLFFSCFAILLPAVHWRRRRSRRASHQFDTANSDQLQEVPGIGPATADKILKMRNRTERSKALTICAAIKGIGPNGLKKCADIDSCKTFHETDSKTSAKILCCETLTIASL